MYYIGIDLGGTNIAVGLVDADGNIIYKDSLPTGRERDNCDIVSDMARLAKAVALQGGVDISDIAAVGIGCPGTVDNERGEVVFSNNIVMHHYPIVKEFKKHLDLPVVLENDANAAALGEYMVYGDGADSFVFITLGTGVGGGIILDGKVYKGFNGAGAELGHQTLVYGGKPCTCGKRGCLEAYASVTALIEQTKEAIAAHPDSMMAEWAKKKNVSGRCAFECAAQGDGAAIEVRDRYLDYVAEGICSTVNMLQPRILAIGGGISREGDILLDPIKKYLEDNDYNKYMPRTDVRIARLFGDAGIVGAAGAAMNALRADK